MSYHAASKRLMYPLGDDLIDQAMAAANPPPPPPQVSSGAGLTIPGSGAPWDFSAFAPAFTPPPAPSSSGTPSGVPNILRGTWFDPNAWSAPGPATSSTLTNPYVVGAAIAIGVLVMRSKKKMRRSRRRPAYYRRYA